MNQKKENPIAEQSRQWLMQALLALMQEKDYHDITVTDIAARADLSRRTFYRIFESKEQVLQHCFLALCEEYVADLKHKKRCSLAQIIEAFFNFWEKHLDFVLLLKQNHLFFHLLEQLNAFVPIVHDTFRSNLHLYGSATQKQFSLLASAGALWNILSEWVSLANRPSPQALAHMLSQSFLNNADALDAATDAQCPPKND